MIKQYLDLADSGTRPGNEDTNIEAYVGNLRYHRRTSVLLDKFELLAKAEAGTDTSFVAAARAKLEEIEKRVEKAKVKVVAKAKVPPEVYEGADKEKLRGVVKDAWLAVNAQFPPSRSC